MFSLHIDKRLQERTWNELEMALRVARGPNGQACVVDSRPQTASHSSNGKESEVNVLFARCAALEERCPPRQTSGVERLKAKVEPLLT